jgi:hypothetical protein
MLIVRLSLIAKNCKGKGKGRQKARVKKVKIVLFFHCANNKILNAINIISEQSKQHLLGRDVEVGSRVVRTASSFGFRAGGPFLLYRH